jgi:peptidoglycan/LPS O-acetylase OafA/YrhL
MAGFFVGDVRSKLGVCDAIARSAGIALETTGVPTSASRLYSSAGDHCRGPANTNRRNGFRRDHAVRATTQGTAAAMKSSTGEHYIALDHVRALAVFMVFSFHFLHGWLGLPVPYGYTPAFFPFSIINQGHTGVALFMTLSGYLFAKLLDGKQVSYPAFFWNRFLRLFPLLIVVLVACGIQTYLNQGRVGLVIYTAMVKRGFLLPLMPNGLPSWPNGAWSITAEMHFYLLLPLILFLGRKSKLCLPAIVLAAIALRTLIHHERGEVQTLAYFTLVGRIDQFVLGIIAFNYRKSIANRHLLFALGFTAFLLYYWQFDLQGGYGKDPSLGSGGAVWIYLPTLEGLAYGLLISYYDSTWQPANTGISKVIGLIGAYSYSIYLLHFFVVFYLPGLVSRHIMALDNFYVACAWSLLCFGLMLPIGYLSFRFIEAPFLKFRRRYFVANAAPPIAAGA